MQPRAKVSHGEWLSFTGHGDTYKSIVKPCTDYRAGSYYDESVRAAQIIYETADSPITCLYGGGSDGEYAVNCFLDAGVPFTVAILSYGKDFKWNGHDTQYAFERCKKHNIEPVIVDLDLEDFVVSGRMLEVCEESQCCEFRMTSTMLGASMIDGTVVMSNEPYVERHNGIWHWTEYERINTYATWFDSRGIEGTSDFGSYTAEQVLAFLEEPYVQKLVANETQDKDSVPAKHVVYNQQHWEQVKRPKYTGWERFQRTELFESLNIRQEMYKFADKYNGVVQIEYNDIVNILKGT